MLVLFAGLVISVVSAQSLTTVEQGYFFTFLSLAAAQTLFELGITNLILHHLSHARARLEVAVTADENREAREVAEATRAYSIRYFLRAAALFFVLIGIGGAVFFLESSNHRNKVSWELPWFLMVAGTALSLFNLTNYSNLEAFGRLDISYQVRIKSTFLLLLVFGILAYGVGGLLSYPVALIASSSYAFVSLRTARSSIDRYYGLSNHSPSLALNIGAEQGKMAVSAVAGYVTANSLTPYAFHFLGAEVAGQVGLTMSIFAAIAAVAMARTTAEAPSYGPLIATGNLGALKLRFHRTLVFSAALAALLCLGVVLGKHVTLLLFPQFSLRVLDTTGFVTVGLLILANVTLSVTSTALRAFKTEQLMWPSVTAALIMLVAQFGFNLNPVQCIALLAAFNGMVFYPYAKHLLSEKISGFAS